MTNWLLKLWDDVVLMWYRRGAWGGSQTKDGNGSKPTGYVTQVLVPNPGKIVVVRERATETYGPNSRVYKTETDVEWESAVNPFSLVVGVGEPETTQYGTQITTTVQIGDKVVVAQVGMNVPLVANGKIDYVYVLGFNGVVGRLELVCGACGHRERHFAHEIKCKKCGAGAAPEMMAEAPVEIVLPQAKDVEDINRGRISQPMSRHGNGSGKQRRSR